MNILAIDTATENCSVALLTEAMDEPALLEAVSPAGHSKLIHGMIERLLNRCDLRHGDLDLVVVDNGPGSFTGVRIGIGVAQGLAYAAGARCLPISSLAALAASCPDGLCVSAIDARMDQVYCALYRLDAAGGRPPELLCGPWVASPSRVKSLIEENRLPVEGDAPIHGAGTGWGAYADQMPKRLWRSEILVDGSALPGALSLIAIAGQMPDTGGESVSPLALHASYVRDDIARKSAS